MKRRSARAKRGSLGRLVLGDPAFQIAKGDPEWRVKYETHLASRAWKTTRQRFIAARGGELACQACEQTENVALHHKTYERLGSELLEDLVPLCPPCHIGVHELHRSGRLTLEAATEALLISPRAAAPRDQPQDFVPANRRSARTLPDGRVVSSLDWRKESRTIQGLTNDWGPHEDE